MSYHILNIRLVSKLAYQGRNGREDDELRGELALIRRDLLERMRRLEDYIMVLDSDIRRMSLEVQRISDRLQESPLEKSLAPSIKQTNIITEPIRSSSPELFAPKIEQESSGTPQIQQVTTQFNLSAQAVKTLEKKEGLNQTEIAIIKYLIDNPGTKSATPIAQTIGKAREHIARTLKKLADEKKIIRDETTWPYTYVVPEDIKKLVQSQTVSTS